MTDMISYPHKFLPLLLSHMEHPQISAAQHALQKRLTLAKEVLQKTRIYLDQKYWIYCRDAFDGDAANAQHKEILDHLVKLVDSGRVLCPISYSTLEETLKQGNLNRRRSTARLIDALGKGIALAPPQQQILIEFCHLWQSQRNQPDAIVSPDHRVWTFASWSVGEWVPNREDLDPTFLVLSALARRYQHLDIVRERAASAASLKSARQREHDAKGAVGQVARKLASEEDEHRKRLSSPQAKLNDIQKEQAAATAAVQRDANVATTGLVDQRRKLADQQATETASVEARANSALGALMKELNRLPALEQFERAKTLRSHQEQHIQSLLRTNRLSQARLFGIGPVVKIYLSAAGVFTAADVEVSRLYQTYGIGPQRAAALLEWRKRLELRAQSSMPKALAADAEQRIRNAFAGREQSFSLQIAEHRRQLEAAKRALQQRYQSRLGQLDTEIASLRRKTELQLARVRLGFQRDQQLLRTQLRTANDQHAAARRAIEAESASAGRTLFQVRLALARQEREFRRFQPIGFPNYIAHILGLRRAG
jgi:hypothetical protein